MHVSRIAAINSARRVGQAPVRRRTVLAWRALRVISHLGYVLRATHSPWARQRIPASPDPLRAGTGLQAGGQGFGHPLFCMDRVKLAGTPLKGPASTPIFFARWRRLRRRTNYRKRREGGIAQEGGGGVIFVSGPRTGG